MDTNAPAKRSKGFVLDYRVVIGILLAVIIGMLIIWKPWEPQIDAKTRTVSVTGQAKVTATPDEFVFTPVYQFKNADRDVALSELSKKSDGVVKELKQLGVADNKIKTNSSGYDYPVYNKEDSSVPTYSLSLTITVDNKDLAQKVQNYLLTTSPTGSVSPQYTFSDAKRKELESKARDEATKDARSKAEQSAKNLGFTIGDIKTVNDGFNFGAYARDGIAGGAGSTDSSSAELKLQPGENDLTYQVSVVYFVK
jgi:uncharacterized protein YggE